MFRLLRSPLSTFTVSLLGLATAAPAQVEDGAYVVSLAPGGLAVVDRGGTVRAVQGLPATSTTEAPTVVVRPDDGLLWVGEVRRGGGVPINLHEVLVSGSTGVVMRTIGIGTTRALGGEAGVSKMHSLPDGGVVVLTNGLAADQPQHVGLVVVTRSGVVTPVALPPVGDFVPSAMAVDPTGGTAWIAVSPLQGRSSDLYAIPLGGGGGRRIGTTAFLTGLTFDGHGNLLGSSNDRIVQVDPTTAQVSLVAWLTDFVADVRVEAATDQPLVVRNSLGPIMGHVERLDPSGALVTVATLPGATLRSITVRDDPRTYGGRTTGSSTYDWEVSPAPGGVPSRGNAGFGVRVVSLAGSFRPGLLVASTAPGLLAVAGLEVLLDPAVAFPAGVVAGPGVVPLPVPTTIPVGTYLFLQSFHPDPGAPSGWAATSGQLIAIMN
ncbi:MAG: hypothetical protein IPM29_06010 [Planctomycetes bacterium]|nr:hypothetical protein [Planctomycetota bacterium]